MERKRAPPGDPDFVFDTPGGVVGARAFDRAFRLVGPTTVTVQAEYRASAALGGTPPTSQLSHWTLTVEQGQAV